MVKSKVKRPVRMYSDSRGNRYIMFKNKKMYIKSPFKNKNLIKILINNVISESKRRVKRPAKKVIKQQSQSLSDMLVTKSTALNNELADQIRKINANGPSLKLLESAKSNLKQLENVNETMKIEGPKNGVFIPQEKLNGYQKFLEENINENNMLRNNLIKIQEEYDKSKEENQKILAEKIDIINIKDSKLEESQIELKKNIIELANKTIDDNFKGKENVKKIADKFGISGKDFIREYNIKNGSKLKNLTNVKPSTFLNGIVDLGLVTEKAKNEYLVELNNELLNIPKKDKSRKKMKKDNAPEKIEPVQDLPVSKPKSETDIVMQNMEDVNKEVDDKLKEFLESDDFKNYESISKKLQNAKTREQIKKIGNYEKELKELEPKLISVYDNLSPEDKIRYKSSNLYFKTPEQVIADEETEKKFQEEFGEYLVTPDKGKGYSKGIGGVYDFEINKIMKSKPNYFKKGFKGCYSADQIKEIPVKKKDKIVSFIYNLDPKDKPGSHWCAVYIDKNNDRSVEYYDPFGNQPPEIFLKDIRSLLEKIKPSTYLKLKINEVRQQRLNSTSCGFFSIKFLFDRYNGKSFKNATKYDSILKNERGIDRIQKKFGFL